MAQNFRNQLTSTAISTSATDILAQADTFDTVVGIRLVNVSGSAINVTCQIVNGSDTTELVKSVPIPAGSSLELIDGGSKIILKSGDKIQALSDTASSLKAVVSFIDAISN
ncbi:MAG: hypothetical protein CMI81_03775 [Candidatus Pelagibacter sp.]|nr:hypothetical protein [Candidatus Pelagibacter sp.]OUV96605.1 MAG: hypothetical protein CBD02_04785 [Candidatus Pelagibacter sp. TMED142]|tara:strand:+ start:1071 stop:1403 length:333 start_codon:yes stop_codon:yes gene_type:complete